MSDRLMRSTEWICGRCGEVLTFAEPARPPAPCPVCGGIVFSTKKAVYGAPPPVP